MRAGRRVARMDAGEPGSLVGVAMSTAAAIPLFLASLAATLFPARWLAVPVAAVLAGLTVGAYLVVVVGGYELLEHRAMPKRIADRLGRALVSRTGHEAASPTSSDPTHQLLALVVVDLVLIIASSF